MYEKTIRVAIDKTFYNYSPYLNIRCINLDEPEDSQWRVRDFTYNNNWKVPIPEIGTTGFLKYLYMQKGEEYITSELKKFKCRSSNCYFIDFIEQDFNDKEKRLIF